MSSPEKIGIIVNSILSDRGYLSAYRENEIIGKWSSIVGNKIASISNCERVENGILYVAITTSSWRNEIQFFKNTILKKIQKEHNCKSIKDIIFI